MDDLIPILPLLLLIPVLLLMIPALIHIFRHPNYRFGNRLLWVLIVLFISIIGPVLYFVIGRSED